MLGGDAFGSSRADITIINYDRLKDHREYLIKRAFASVICDESHYLKSPTAQRTHYTEEICEGVLYERKGKKLNRREKTELGSPIDVRLLLTGTPIQNRPNEAATQ